MKIKRKYKRSITLMYTSYVAANWERIAILLAWVTYTPQDYSSLMSLCSTNSSSWTPTIVQLGLKLLRETRDHSGVIIITLIITNFLLHYIYIIKIIKKILTINIIATTHDYGSSTLLQTYYTHNFNKYRKGNNLNDWFWSILNFLIDYYKVSGNNMWIEI